MFTFDNNTVADLFKEAHGYRPSLGWMLQWDNQSDEDKQKDWDYLLRIAEEVAVREELEKADAAKRVEERIADCISFGATDRETAIRWIADAEDCIQDGIIDYGYLEYTLGVHYGYLSI